MKACRYAAYVCHEPAVNYCSNKCNKKAINLSASLYCQRASPLGQQIAAPQLVAETSRLNS